MTAQRRRRTDPRIVRTIHELATQGATLGAIRAQLERTYPGEQLPGDRTITNIAGEVRSAAAQDTGEPWTFLDDLEDQGPFSPEDARLVMDLLAGHEDLRLHWAEQSEHGVVPRGAVPRRPSRDLARLIVRIRRAYPRMPAQAASTFAYQYLAARDDPAARERLDYELAYWATQQELQAEEDDQP